MLTSTHHSLPPTCSNLSTHTNTPTQLSSSSPPSSSSTPLILYKSPSLWGLARGAAINLLLPFVNGLMLGFGELVANEFAFRLGWSGTKVRLITLWWRGLQFGVKEGANVWCVFRSSRHNAATRDEWDRAWRCVRIQ
jgi:hypothetical protein